MELVSDMGGTGWVEVLGGLGMECRGCLCACFGDSICSTYDLFDTIAILCAIVNKEILKSDGRCMW